MLLLARRHVRWCILVPGYKLRIRILGKATTVTEQVVHIPDQGTRAAVHTVARNYHAAAGGAVDADDDYTAGPDMFLVRKVGGLEARHID